MKTSFFRKFKNDLCKIVEGSRAPWKTIWCWQLCTCIRGLVDQHRVHGHDVWSSETLHILQDLTNKTGFKWKSHDFMLGLSYSPPMSLCFKLSRAVFRKETLHREWNEHECVCVNGTSGKEQYRNSSGSSWKSWSLDTAFWSWTNSDLAMATSRITTRPGTFTSCRQMRSNSFLNRWNNHRSLRLLCSQPTSGWKADTVYPTSDVRGHLNRSMSPSDTRFLTRMKPFSS